MLRISDETIPVDYYKVLPIENRFIKLPAENYLNLIDIEPCKPQYAILNAVNDPRYRFVTACVSRRVGKTFIANVILQLIALQPRSTVLIIAPDYALASISWDLQHELLRKFDVETTRDNAKDRIIELVNGSMIRIAAVSKIDSAVGRSYDLIIFDEAAIADDAGAKYNVALRPTLDKLNSKVIFISTPRGDNWFREFFERGFSDEPKFKTWLSIHADHHENPRASDSDIAEARATLSHAEFEQEYLANFVTFEGQVYSLDNDQIVDLSSLIERVKAEPHKVDVIGGLDVGFRDETAMCCIVCMENEEGLNEYFIIDEYFANHKSTKTHAEQIGRLMDKYEIDFNYIDAAAAQTRFDFAATYDITCIKAKKSILDGIGSVAAVIDNHRLWVHHECIEVIYALRNHKWKMDTELEKTEPNRARHMADAIRYAIYTYESGVGGIS